MRLMSVDLMADLAQALAEALKGQGRQRGVHHHLSKQRDGIPLRSITGGSCPCRLSSRGTRTLGACQQASCGCSRLWRGEGVARAAQSGQRGQQRVLRPQQACARRQRQAGSAGAQRAALAPATGAGCGLCRRGAACREPRIAAAAPGRPGPRPAGRKHCLRLCVRLRHPCCCCCSAWRPLRDPRAVDSSNSPRFCSPGLTGRV